MGFLAQFTFWGGVALCFPCVFLLLEVMVGLWPRRQKRTVSVDAHSSVLLIPAHNEEAGIEAMLSKLLEAQNSEVKILIIADNCSDQTATIAQKLGVEVWEREDKEKRGKPWALHWALSRLAKNPPAAVVCVDADWWLARGNAADLATSASAHQRPVQALNLMEGGGLRGFAFRFRNEARLCGLANLGAPCQLNGTGFAMPWTLVEKHPIPVGELAEDASWGWALTMKGVGPVLMPNVEVRSHPPAGGQGVQTQLRRWEHGVMSATLRHLPKLLVSALIPPRLGRIFHLADICVPPLALLTILCFIFTVMDGFSHDWRLSWPFVVAWPSLLLAVLIGWFRYGRETVPFSKLLLAPVYAMGKVGIYTSFLFRREKGWKRTEREES